MTLQKRALFTAVTAIAIGSVSQAADKTWIAPGTSGNWNYTTANWSPSTFVAGDSAVFGAGYAPNVSVQTAGVNASSVLISSGDYTFSGGAISTASLTKNGSGVLTLSNNNTITQLTLNQGILKISGPANINSLQNNALVFGGESTLQVTGSYAWSGDPVNGLSPKTITLNAPATMDMDGAGSSLGFKSLSGPGSLTKTGAGTYVLGDGTYTGPTTVNAGTLRLVGEVVSSIDVGPNGTLTGNGKSGSVLVQGTLSPGVNGISTLMSTGTQTWADEGTYALSLGTAVQNGIGTSDRVTMTSLVVDDGFTVDLGTTAPTNFNGASGVYEWLIASVTTGSITGALSGIDVTHGFAIGPNGGFSIFTVDNASGTDYVGVRYAYNAVPEATTLLLGLVGMAPLAMHRRRVRA